MPAARYDMAAVELDGSVYVIGGQDRRDRALSSVIRYDPSEDRWSEVASMEAPRYDAAAVVLAGKIYVIGGADDENEALDAVSVYDPSSNEWSQIGDLHVERRGHQAAVVDERLYVVGGVDEDNKLIRDVDVFDPDEGAWSISDRWMLQNPRVAFALVAVQDEYYVLGGLGEPFFEPLQAGEVFTPGKGVAPFLPPISFRAKGYLAGSVAGHTAFLLGGNPGTRALADVTRFTPSAADHADRWLQGPEMRTPRERFAAVSVDGRLYAIGGRDHREAPLHSVESLLVGTGVEQPHQAANRPELEQNHPNPFMHSTTISFVVGSEPPQGISLEIYDPMGRRVCTLADGPMPPGRHDVVWDGRGGDGREMTSGSYFFVLRQNGRRVARTMTRIR